VTRILSALLIGTIMGALTVLQDWWLRHSTMPLTLFNISNLLQLPGYIAGAVANDNVHVPNPNS
jgi:hypothetical protein